MKKGVVVALLLVLILSLFSVAAQDFWDIFSSSNGAVVLVEIQGNNSDYEGYQLLDMDDDEVLTEEDLALKLEEINQQAINTTEHLSYLKATYDYDFSLLEITTTTAIRESSNDVEYESLLPTTRAQLETLAEQVNNIQNTIGDMDQTDPNITPLKQYLDQVDYNIYLALWYTGRG